MQCISKYKLISLILDIFLHVWYQISYILLPITQQLVATFLNECETRVNGGNAYDPKVTDDRFYCELLVYGFDGIGYAYVKNYFVCNDLLTFCEKIRTLKNYQSLRYHPSIYLRSLIERYLSRDTNGEGGGGYDKHKSDIKESNTQQPNLTFSTGYWKNADTLEAAMRNKFDLVSRKLKLRSKMWILDVGCGDGTLCKYFADNYDVSVIGVDVSKDHISKATQRCSRLSVTIKEMSCMNVTGLYNRITCVQVLEYLGHSNIRPFFQRMHRYLTEDGLILVECNVRFNSSVPQIDIFTEYHIGAKYYIPSMKHILRCIDGLFVIEDVQNMTNHMASTNLANLKELSANKSDIDSRYGRRCFRSKEAVISLSTASLTNHCWNVCQIVLSKNGFNNGYEAEI